MAETSPTTPPPAGFTPGPWTAQTKAEMTPATAQLIKPKGYAAYVSAANWLALASVIVKTEDGESAEGAANARLIAAAPDLYAACKAMAGGYGAEEIAAILKRGCNGSVLSLAVHALAKAGGGA